MDIKEKALEIMNHLTLEEKAELLSGKDFWHFHSIPSFQIPSYKMADGPHGLRAQDENKENDNLGLGESIPAVCYPTASAIACSFDEELVSRVGKMIAKECKAHQVSLLLGPAVNLKRSPLCGRNFEYYSEDPMLSGALGEAFVKGVQSEGVGCCVKHFACNNQEKARMISDSILDERTLNEIYLKPFERIVKNAHPWSMMTAYNKVNGTYCSENYELMNEIARNKWGFDGAFITDWGAMSSIVRSYKFGCNLEMPGTFVGTKERILKAAKNKELFEEEINKAVLPTIELILKCHEESQSEVDFSKDEALKLAYEASIKSSVLLKNENDILPLNKKENICIVGSFAKNARYQGSGSSKVNSIFFENPYSIWEKECESITFSEGFKENDIEPDIVDITKALDCAKKADIVIVYAGLPEKIESEGYDREDLSLPKSQNECISRIAEVNENVIVVLQIGSPVAMPWIDKVKGVLCTYLGGSMSSQATIDLLLGRANPSGHLAETFPLTILDTPTYISYGQEKKQVLYKESIYIGYRYYETFRKNVLFPFGYGLSYTKFEYQNISKKQDKNSITIELDVQNVGIYEGTDLIQLYISEQNPSIYRPKLELNQFKKVTLNPGETKHIVFECNTEDFAFYSTSAKSFVTESSHYFVYLGNSVRDIFYTVKCHINGIDKETSKRNIELNKLYDVRYTTKLPLKNNQFEKLIDKPIPPVLPFKEFTIDTPISEINQTLVGKMMLKMMTSEAKKRLKDTSDASKMLEYMLYDLPLRAISMGGSDFGRDFVEGLISVLNGKYISGAKSLTSKEKTKNK